MVMISFNHLREYGLKAPKCQVFCLGLSEAGYQMSEFRGTKGRRQVQK
jgi:hypothetical protein